MHDKIKTAIIGVGSMSYFQTLKQFSIIDIAGVWDEDSETIVTEAEKENVYCFNNFEEILEDPQIKLVINAAKPGITYDYSVKLLENNKNVYVGKLIADTFEKGQKLVSLAKEKNLLFASGPDCFMNGGMQTARWLIDHKMAGNIRSGSVLLNRNSRLFGEFITYLYEKDGSILHDVGCYYILPLLEMLGPVAEVSAFGIKTEKEHEMKRLGGIMFGETHPVPDNNIFVANLKFVNDVLVTVNFNGATAILQSYDFALYGDNGIIGMGHPHDYDIPVTLQTAQSEPKEVPFTHGFTKDVHFGIAAAEMAWSMIKERAPRQNADTALHLLEVTKAIEKSADEGGRIHRLTTTMKRQKPLPAGFIGNLPWEPGEESALI